MEPLAVVTRNGYIESVHYGYICIVSPSGVIEYHLGDWNTRIFFRSSAKPIQVIPLLQSGAADAFGFSLRDIAIACASHSGQPLHQMAVQEILHRLELDETDLSCGIMRPYNVQENQRLIATESDPTVLHCSCSGKHAAMLALAKFRNHPRTDYSTISHPVQQEILQTVAMMAGVEADSISLGIDGCGVPIYLLPIRNIAWSYANLVQSMQDHTHPFHRSCQTIFEAMNAHPDMVAGDGEFCTELMQATHGKLIGKVGCEAVYCLGIREPQLGICIKIVDGNERAVYPVVVQLLKELGVLNNSEYDQLQRWSTSVLQNNLGEPIGAIHSIARMKQPLAPSELLGRSLQEIGLFAT